MKNEEILNTFGEILIKRAYDNHAGLVKHDLEDLKQTERFKHLFLNMTSVQKLELERLSFEILSGLLFDFLQVFEEHEEFKIVYEMGDKQVDLMTISEMLKAAPIIEGGWIDRFSQYSDKTK
jgi:hypothetical protein